MDRRTQIRRLQGNLRAHLGPMGGPWIPKEARLLGAPTLLPSEAFSSWCWRIAVQSGVPIRAVLRCLGVSSPSFWVDSGRVDLDLQRISIATGMPHDDIADLAWPNGSLLSDPHFACLMTEPLDQRPIYRYCELCLCADSVPYIRRLWRLTCACVCPIHENVLRDKCPQCEARVDLSKDKLRPSGSIRDCVNCGADLCDSTPVFLPDELLFLVLILQTGYIRLISRSAPSPEDCHWLPPSAPSEMITGQRNLMDLSLEPGIQEKYGRLITGYWKTESNSRPPEVHIQSLKNCLAYVTSRDCSPALPTVATGIKGNVFGQESGELLRHLKKCQTLARGTHLWYEDRKVAVVQRYRYATAPLTDAARWIKALGSSKNYVRPL